MSSPRPPWFDSQMMLAPDWIARRASDTDCMPFAPIGILSGAGSREDEDEGADDEEEDEGARTGLICSRIQSRSFQVTFMSI